MSLFAADCISSLDVSGTRPLFSTNQMIETVFEEYNASRFRVFVSWRGSLRIWR
ncbi:MAG: hypothetical protein R2865_17710 [Deinococcales bacterium]